MLSKNNKILIGCLALLLVMSVGYALFSETITVNGTATAKGEFSITTEALEESDEAFSIYTKDISRGVVENPIINVVGNQVTSNVTLGAPGSSYTFGIKVTNTGSIPARLKSIRDVTNNELILDSTLEDGGSAATPFYCSNDGNDRICAELYTEDSYWSDYDVDISERMLEEQNFNVEMTKAVLDPGESIYYFIEYMWSSNSTSQENTKDLNWQLEFDFEQITN